MLKVMLIQRGGATTHRVIDESTRFKDFVELVTYENFKHTFGIKANEAMKTVQVPYSGTTYTLIEIAGAQAC